MKRCKASGKRKFRMKTDALITSLHVSASPVGATTGGAYVCPHCGFWHLTSKVKALSESGGGS